MSEACRKLRRASCCVIGTLRTHPIRCQRGPIKNDRADAESPPKSRPFRLDACRYPERESHEHLLCLAIMRTLKSFLAGRRRSSAPGTENARADYTGSAADATGVFAYPPADPGIPGRSIDEVFPA